MTEQAWERFLMDSTPRWVNFDAPALLVNLEEAFKSLTRREKLVMLLWYQHGDEFPEDNESQTNRAIVALLQKPADQGDPIVVNEHQVHAYRMKALAKLKRPDVQRILRRQPDSVAA